MSLQRIPRSPQVEPQGVEQPSRGRETEVALQSAQSIPRTNINQAGSASGYSRLVDTYNNERKLAAFTNKNTGLLVSGASMTYRIQQDGSVQAQTAATYVAKYEATKPESLLQQAQGLLGEASRLRGRAGKDPESQRMIDLEARALEGEALVKAVDAPLSRALQQSNPELEPTFVREHETNRATKRFMAMNEVAPDGDPTGAPVFAQSWMASENGGMIPVYGFTKKDGRENRYLGIKPGCDDEGGRTLGLVSVVNPVPGLENGQRSIRREYSIDETFPIETASQQLEMLGAMAQRGWSPITSAPPPNADLPQAFRGLSEVNVASRTVLRLASAVAEHDVIRRGFAFATDPNPAALKDLPAFERGLVEDYARQANLLKTGAGLAMKAVERLYGEMDAPLRKLGALHAVVDGLRRSPSAMDPITEFRQIATSMLKAGNTQAKDLYVLFDDPEENFKRRVSPEMHRAFTASDNIRKAVLEQLAKDLTDALEAWPKEKGEPWKTAEGKPLAFPDGTPRTSTPFDKALARGGAHYDKAREAYYGLTQASMNAAAAMISVQLLMAARAKAATGMAPADAGRLATDYANSIISGRPMANPADEALVRRTLSDVGPTNKYLDEITRMYAYAPLVAAHRAGLSPAEFQRAMEANAKDHEPWSAAVKSYQVYSYNSVPEPSGPTLFVAPEQELPSDFDPTSPEQVEALAKNRTWRVVRLQDEDGRPVPSLVHQGLSHADMVAKRLEANEKNLPVAVARKPLPENTPLGRALAKTFNMPVVEGADPIDGTPGKYATLGARISGAGVATAIAPSYYKAINFSKAPVVDREELVQLFDEAEFASSIGIERAKRAIESEMKGEPKLVDTISALDDMARPVRERGVYAIETTEPGIKKFESQRMAAIEAMTTAQVAVATQEFKLKARGLPPDRRAGLETERDQAIAGAKARGAAKQRELDVLIRDFRTFVTTYRGRTGYTGFAPSLGAGNPARRIHKPGFELRCPDAASLQALKARLNRRGLNIRFDQFEIPE